MRGDEEYKFKWSGNHYSNNYDIKICENSLVLKLDGLRNSLRMHVKYMYNEHPAFKKIVIKISKFKLFSQAA